MPVMNARPCLGYCISICDRCFSGCELQGVFNPIEFECLTKPTHECDPTSREQRESLKDVPDIKSKILVKLMNELTGIVLSRIGQEGIYLKILEVPQIFTEERRKSVKLKLPTNRVLIEEKDCIDIDLSAKDKTKDHWSHRIIKDYGDIVKTKITQNELKEFLSITKPTFGVFRFSVRNHALKCYLLIYLVI
jgi:hypothetical protein